MGFRYPVTSATDVDTRTTISAPGMYTTESVDASGNTTVTVHLTDGFGTDADATITRTASVNPRSQAQSQSGGTSVGGGSYGGATAPHIEYNVELQGDGSKLAVLRAKGAALVDFGGAQLGRRVTARATATQSIGSSSAVPTPLTFGAASNSAGWQATNPTQLLPVAGAGDYDLSVFVPWPANGTGTRGIAYRVSGGTWQWVQNRGAGEASFGSEQTAEFPGITLTAGQYVEVGVWQNSGAALSLPVSTSEATRVGLTRAD